MTDNINKLIDFIRSEAIAFDMCYWNDDFDTNITNHQIADSEREVAESCGTVACIGGTAGFLMKQEMKLDFIPNNYDDVFDWIMKGVPENPDKDNEFDSDDLFEPDTDTSYYGAAHYDEGFISRHKAIQVLERLRDTGELNWDL